MSAKVVHVTDVDIVVGKPSSLSWCPIAVALRRACGEPIEVRADTWRRTRQELAAPFVVKTKARALTVRRLTPVADPWIPLPPRVVRWIRRFDRGAKVRPLSFAVDRRQVRKRIEPAPDVDTSTPAPFLQLLAGLLRPECQQAIAAWAADHSLAAIAKAEGR